VTPEEQELIMSMAVVPGRGHEVSPEEVLRHFGTSDGSALGLSLLRDAVERRDADDVEMALIVGATFGFTMDYLDLLVELTSAEWHHKHEDVVSALGQLRTPDAVDALEWMAQWIPGYLDFDENRALATKATWALGGTPGPEAEQALVGLLGSDSEIVREEAKAQLKRREKS
jgi:HEAT repeat protein